MRPPVSTPRTLIQSPFASLVTSMPPALHGSVSMPLCAFSVSAVVVVGVVEIHASPPRPEIRDRPQVGVARSQERLPYCGVRISIATLFDGSVTRSDLPEMVQLEAASVWMFTASVALKSLNESFAGPVMTCALATV